MQTELKRLVVLQTGYVFAGISLFLAVVIGLPSILIPIAINPKGAAGSIQVVFQVILTPVSGFIGGFFVGVISAALYNLAVKWIGGLRFELEQRE